MSGRRDYLALVALANEHRKRSIRMDIYPIFKDRLYQSPRVTDWQKIRDLGVTVLINMARETYDVAPKDSQFITFLNMPILDGPDLPDLTHLHLVAQFAARCIDKKLRVLVSCNAGINRSSLMSGCILYWLGFESAEIVPQIREHRPGALSNETFAHYLKSLSQESHTLDTA